MSVTQAMEWLIEHVDDPSVDAPIPGQDSSMAAGAAAAATAGPSTSASASGPKVSRSLSSQSSTEESSRQDELTEIFKRIRRKREFRPDSRVCGIIQLKYLFLLVFSYNSQAKPCFPLQAVIALMEMGFDEKEVVDALRVNNNQQDAAVGVLVVKQTPHILTTILTG